MIYAANTLLNISAHLTVKHSSMKGFFTVEGKRVVGMPPRMFCVQYDHYPIHMGRLDWKLVIDEVTRTILLACELYSWGEKSEV